MKGVLEITGGTLRLHEDVAAVFGAPIVGSMSVVGDEGVATIKGLMLAAGRPFDAEVAAAVMDELRRVGFTGVRYSRHSGAAVRWIERTL